MEKEKYLTPEGLEKLKKELEYLTMFKRKEIAARLRHAASFGDLSENAAYDEAKESQAFLEGRILELENLVRDARIVIMKNISKTGRVQIGSTVLVVFQGEKRKFSIVGSIEAEPSKGKISSDSPLGRSLLGKKKGETFEVETPEGKVKYKIVRVD